MDQAVARGIVSIVGVANANSTPGFLRHLGFSLVRALPVRVAPPLPGRSHVAIASTVPSDARLAGILSAAGGAGRLRRLDARVAALAIGCARSALRGPGWRRLVGRHSRDTRAGCPDRRGAGGLRQSPAHPIGVRRPRPSGVSGPSRGGRPARGSQRHGSTAIGALAVAAASVATESHLPRSGCSRPDPEPLVAFRVPRFRCLLSEPGWPFSRTHRW